MLIGIFVPQKAYALGVAGIRDALADANFLSPGPSLYEVQAIAERGGPIICGSGMRILPDKTIATAEDRYDTLIVASERGVPQPPSPTLLKWLRGQAAVTERCCAVGSGAFMLGAAGILDGRHVTTHWRQAKALAAAFPAAIVEPDRIYLKDGSIFTSAGATAAIDLCLALIEEDHGRDLALAVARELIVYLKRPGGQSQFSVQLAAQTATRSSIEQLQHWIRDNLAADLSHGALAQRAAMSERNLSRVFREQTGMSVGAFVESTRVDAARRLLERDIPLQTIAERIGLTGPEALRRAFLRRIGISPRDYRSRFQSAKEDA